MSSISSASGASGLFQFLQSLSPANATTSATAAGSASNSSGGAAVSGHHHKHGGGGFEKLANAVTSALQSVGSGAAASDVNQTITEALTKIFKNGSLSPTGENDPTATDPTQQGSDADGTPDTSGTNGGLPAAFVQTLKSFGVTPQQFQTDLAAAMKTAEQSGTLDPSAAFKSFPAGSVVDTVG